MSIIYIILIIAVGIAAIRLISEFAVGVARAIIYVGLGLFAVYLFVVYKDVMIAWITSLAH
jgi:hypothetical protein